MPMLARTVLSHSSERECLPTHLERARPVMPQPYKPELQGIFSRITGLESYTVCAEKVDT